MTSRNERGWLGWGVAAVLGVILVSRCESDQPTDLAASAPVIDASASATFSRGARSIEWRYVHANTLNCRRDASTSSAVLDRLSSSAYVAVVDERSGWSLIDRPTDCWVRSSYLGRERRRVEVAPQRFTARSNARSAYYRNCSAARAAGAAPVYRGQPGYGSHLDRDNDGIGCE